METRSVEAIFKALNEASVRYLVVGGLAVNAYGYVRMTRDVDLVLELKEDNILRGLDALFHIGYQMAIPATPQDFAREEIREQWRTEKNMIVLKLWSEQHLRTPVDIFIREPFVFEDEIQKARYLDLSSGVSAPIVDLQSLIRMKQEAARQQDLVDIQELTRNQ